MKYLIHRGGKTATALGLTIAALLAIVGTSGAAVSGEWTICQRALGNCTVWAIQKGIASEIALFVFLGYCLAGYEFCQKYVVFYIS